MGVRTGGKNRKWCQAGAKLTENPCFLQNTAAFPCLHTAEVASSNLALSIASFF